MCGIVGWVNLKDNIRDNVKVIEEMRDTLEFRGPDSYGIECYTHALLGHRRLAIVDPTGGLQPMNKVIGDQKYTIVYNGELYNTEEVRAELLQKGYTFKSYSDTEVLLTAFIEYGKDCVNYINGIYAFGVWDEHKQELFLGRDPLGVKPLFYAFKDNSLVFGSEIKAILKHPSIEPIVDKEGLLELMSLGPQRKLGGGIFKEIKEIPPAYYLVFNENGIQLKEYWKLEAKEHEEDLEVTTSYLRDLLVDAIEGQLVSDVPVCTFLSGGLDSSFISHVTSQSFKRENKGNLHTFSVDYTDNDKFFKTSEFQPNSDAYWVVKMTEYLKSDHHNIVLDNEELAYCLKQATIGCDLPLMADIDSSLYLFAKEVRKYATVALSGECADEVFGGYPWYTKNYDKIEIFPWADSVSYRKSILSNNLKSLPIEEYVKQMCSDSIAKVPKLAGESKKDSLMREMYYLNIKWFMVTLLNRKDRMTMANSLEVRVPFADKRLVEYAFNIPADMKLLNGREKGLLREAMRTILPDEIIDRKKSPYPKTHNPLYTETVKGMLKNIINKPNARILDIIDKGEIENIINTNGESFTKPWFGQLMTGPQVMAYLVQLDTWINEYNIKFELD
ncbi:asparagine synthase (glutamine-hydrolyzing) [Romboutsia sp.]|uniref:asparagine synthase (glutamine-hydrolyzing) n=1 Tax=Romboutsia sp. TaxID=1965302 RepID=UPI003F2BFC39